MVLAGQGAEGQSGRAAGVGEYGPVLGCGGRLRAGFDGYKGHTAIDGIATFGTLCADCPLAAACTTSAAGRRIRIGRYEAELTRARITQQDPAWRADIGPPVQRWNASSA